MKKITFILMAVAIIALQSWAAPVDESTARSIAQRFLSSGAPSLRAASANGMRLLHVEMGTSKVNQPVYYIYNTSTTFLVVAGDDRAEEILMVGDRPLKGMNNLAPGMKDMLGQYKEEIEFLHDNPALAVEKRVPRLTSQQETVYGPLLTSLWDQEAPYWNQCVFDYDGTFCQCYTGCPATSSAMVLHYWKYPTTQVDAIDSYSSIFNVSSSISIEDYVYPSLPPTTFDWANMKDTYDDYTADEGDAVATLMRYVGQAVEMMYGTEDASGSGIYNTETQKLVDMFVRFGYDATTCQVVSKAQYSAEAWEALIQNEMAEGRPVVYIGIAKFGGGHAFNVDGYDGSINKYHVNFGWSGIGNAWCAMNSFAYGSYKFNLGQQAVIGIQPPSEPLPASELTVAPAMLSFTTLQGGTASKTFTVTGSNLTGNLTLTLNDESGNYSIDKTVITQQEAADGATVAVTYSPCVLGSSSASVTISGAGVESQTVSLQGDAIEENVIYTDVSSLSFDPTYTGYSTSRTITVKAIVTENIELSWRSDRPGFGLSTYTITPERAAAGAKVTVYFQPSWTSMTTNTLLIKSEGAETVSIHVSGTKIKSDGYITAWSSNLSFETQVGTPVTKTFRVHYSVSNGNDAIMISDPDSGDVVGAINGTNVTILNNSSSNIGSLGTRSGGFNRDLDKLIPGMIDLDSIRPIILTGLQLEMSGDGGFAITPKRISMADAKAGCDVTVTYNPESVGTHDATITIKLLLGSAKPMTVRLHGTATAGTDIITDGDMEDEDETGNEETTRTFDTPFNGTGSYMTTGVEELVMDVKIYAEGGDIVIETPVEQSAIISDIAGRARRVNLEAGRNVIPGNGNGVHIVRVGEKTAKLMLK